MGINMELPNKVGGFFKCLDENIVGEIKAILRSDISPDVLKLPWDNGEKDYNSNSVVPETLEPQEHWQRYGIDETTITTFDVAGTTASIMTPSMSGTLTCNGAFVVQYPGWTAIGGNAYPNSGTGDPNAYQYMPGVTYAPQLYSPNDVINASPNRENDRRGGRGRNRKNDPYNRVMNSNDLQTSYLVQQSQFNQMQPICHHPGMSYAIPYAVASPQQHPAAGRPIFMPSHQSYNQPQIHTHHNSHPQYTHPGYSTHTTAKHHNRQSSGQNYYNQDSSNSTTKNISNVHSKIHEKKIHDNNTTDITQQQQQQTFRQLPTNNNDYELSKKNKSIVNSNNDNSSLTNNGHVNVVVPKKQNEIKKDIESIVVKTPIVEEKLFMNDKSEIKVEEAIIHPPITPIINLPVNRDVVKPVEENICPPCEQPVIPVKSTTVETTIPVEIPKVNGEEIKNDDIVVKQVPEISVTIQEIKTVTTVTNCTSPTSSSPTVAQAPPSYSEKTFASILRKTNEENNRSSSLNYVNKSQHIRSNVSDSSVSVDNTTKNHQQDGGSKRRSVPFTSTDNEISSKNVNNNAINDRKKSSKNSVQNVSYDPAVYRIGEFLLNYQMDKHTVSLLPRGLTNRSNYCYINSILQALLACPPFYNLLKALPYTRHSSKNSTTPLIDNMVRFVNEFDPLPEGQRLPRKDLRAQKKSEDVATDIQAGVAFEPSYVYTMLKNASCAGVFSVEGRQEDAEEFLSCLLNGISDEMLELMKQVGDDVGTPATTEPNVNYNSGDEEWKVMGPRNKGSITRCTEFGKTPLSDIFRGQLRSRILRQGEESTDNVQPFFTLQLDIEKIDSVTNALETLVAKDQVEGMMCSKTKQQIKAWKQVTLEELPVILILHLKWFDYKLDGCSKIFKNVTYGIDLKLDSKFLSVNIGKKLTAKQKQYKLFAVTYHDGKEATKGHYVTDAFHVGYGAWVRYDDSSVKGIAENEVLNPTIPRVPYLLYYRRCDTIGNNQPNNNTRLR
ncbi:hypothetical protein PV325_000624 [Microctonus aethiopoides]|nr:hypothetical protein PV325_000624 [Microctonus aethiopoides]